MSELAKRWAVAIVGIPSVLGLVYLGGWFLAAPLAGFAAWGAHEVYRMAAEKQIAALEPLGWVAAPALVLLASWQRGFEAFAPWGMAVVFLLAASCLLGAMAWRGPDGHPLAAGSITLIGALYLGLLAFMPLLHALGETALGAAGRDPWAGLLLLMLPLACTWVGDAAAFFAGRAWGRRKMAPNISPNKSWVGFWANVIGAAVAASGWGILALPRLTRYSAAPLVMIAAMGAFIGLAAVLGDLVESLLKREAGVKDSGSFFPGHGGVLDRIDSLLFTVPAAYGCIVLLGVFV